MASAPRTLWLKWLLLNALASVFLIVAGIVYHARLHGATLVAVPLILLVFAYATGWGGRIAWRWGADIAYSAAAADHDARYLTYWAWVTQVLGIMSTVVGFWLLLSGGSDTSTLGDRIQSGGGVALLGTFVGIFCSLVLAAEQRMIEHDLGA